MMYLIDESNTWSNNEPFHFNITFQLVDNISLVEFFISLVEFFLKDFFFSFTPNPYRVDLVIVRILNS